MTSNRNQARLHRLLTLGILLALLAVASPVHALPPPIGAEELAQRSDLVIEGRVAKIWPYAEWLAYLKEGGLGAGGKALLREAPATAAGLVQRLYNFPYRSMPTVQVAVDGVQLAEVRVEKTLKGRSAGVIFIPFLRYHFVSGGPLEGPWTERPYHAGEHLKLYLRQNGPFYESTYWNAVQNLDK